mmetsp:Transcript_26509/g.33097  ORF Transcript_26509/g.33097 Transcript_26509/m.33097 type:complete len:200 (-) Transcript_26509:9-608(-)
MESIYNLVPEEYVEVKKPPMYRSKHDPKGPITGSTLGTFGTTQLAGAGALKQKNTGTFGNAPGKSRPRPNEFLRKGEKRQPVPSAKETTVIPYKFPTRERKPGVPLKDEKPVMGLKTTKNFITANAVETILQVPTLRGKPEPDYLNKADYGKVPGYLAEVKNEIKRENEMIDAYVREQMGYETRHQAQYEQMSEVEREA